MKPLRAAWKRRAGSYRADVDHLGGEGHVLAWHDRVVVASVAEPGTPELCEILDRNGDPLERVPTPGQARRRSPSGPVITWPDETLAIGILDQQFSVMWIDFEDTPHVVATDLAPTGYAARVDLRASSGGEVFAAIDTEPASTDGLGWTIEPRLDSLFGAARRAPFVDHEQITRCVARDGVRWSSPGRVAAVADDVAICEEGSGSKRAIVGRRIADGGELWRREAIDRFVLGSIGMPAWSDDRVYIVDRGERRRQAWAREAETARIHGVAVDRPMHTLLSVPAVQRARREQPIVAPSLVGCWSTRTGDARWQTPVDGDVVSFYCHANWLAAVVAGHAAGTLRVWQHDGQLVAESPLAPRASAHWPPDPGRWPCIVHGDAEHVFIAENRVKAEGGARCYEAELAAPGTPTWELALPVNCVHAPLLRNFRFLNRAPIAFTNDAAFLRWGKQLHGFLCVRPL